MGAIAKGITAGIVEGVDDFALEWVGTSVCINLFLQQADPCIVVTALVTK